MIDQRRLSLHDLVIGEPLPWDVYGAGNTLLLRRGHVLQSARQAEDLVERGLFIDAGQAAAAQARTDESRKAVEPPSALRMINLATRRLERLLHNLGNDADAEGKIREVVKALGYAVDVNTDVALACIQLNRSAAGYAIRHGVDTALMALAVMREMRREPDEIRSVASAALTMNLSMLRQQDHLQDKQEPLSGTERELIHSHPGRSVAILAEARVQDSVWLDCVRLHHEEADGSGYPLGEMAGTIPEPVRILALADRCCAAISPRRYKKTLLPASALRDVLMRNGKAVEPMLAAWFIKVLGTTPPGTLVRLQDGEIGVVTHRSGPSNAPIVHAFIGPRGSPLSFPIKRDTGKPLHAVREAIAPDQTTLLFSMQQLWGVDAAP